MAAKKSLMDTLQPFDKAAAVAEPPAREEGNTQKPPSRRGKRAITGYTTQEAWAQFKILGVEQNKDGQALFDEMLNDLFIKYAKPPIA